ncbi:unnamed protein product [Eruca vesicaria subsp. sativa]|uniref:Uncharacterized protein n=1 Tax=Eruca vesicaria subsp. sativa TaxID=29727 RepID=A0ABC8JA09_ERUVS|nr:unnamed protein product [Eruca vesicaria subsp. sativa]
MKTASAAIFRKRIDEEEEEEEVCNVFDSEVDSKTLNDTKGFFTSLLSMEEEKHDQEARKRPRTTPEETTDTNPKKSRASSRALASSESSDVTGSVAHQSPVTATLFSDPLIRWKPTSEIRV